MFPSTLPYNSTEPSNSMILSVTQACFSYSKYWGTNEWIFQCDEFNYIQLFNKCSDPLTVTGENSCSRCGKCPYRPCIDSFMIYDYWNFFRFKFDCTYILYTFIYDRNYGVPAVDICSSCGEFYN